MNRLLICRFLASIFVLATACDQEVDKGDDKLTEGYQEMTVQFKDSVQVVDFNSIETSYPVDPEQPVVYIKDIVEKSGLLASKEGTWYNFIGEDGYHPIGGPCIDYAPVPWESASQGYIERGTTRLFWPDSLGFPKCLFVRDVVKIEIAETAEELPLCGDSCWAKDSSGQPTDPNVDAGTKDGGPASDLDEAAPLDIVNVHYQDQVYPVDVTALATTTINGQTVFTLAAIIQGANLGVSLLSLTVDVKGNDNWPPEGTCPELPAPGSWAEKIGITQDTSTLVWDPSLEGDCHIRLMNGGHLYLEAAPAQ